MLVRKLFFLIVTLMFVAFVVFVMAPTTATGNEDLPMNKGSSVEQMSSMPVTGEVVFVQNMEASFLSQTLQQKTNNAAGVVTQNENTNSMSQIQLANGAEHVITAINFTDMLNHQINGNTITVNLILKKPLIGGLTEKLNLSTQHLAEVMKMKASGGAENYIWPFASMTSQSDLPVS